MFDDAGAGAVVVVVVVVVPAAASSALMALITLSIVSLFASGNDLVAIFEWYSVLVTSLTTSNSPVAVFDADPVTTEPGTFASMIFFTAVKWE